MGKIKNYLYELAEMYSDMLWHSNDTVTAKRNMQNDLSEDEYEFFEENLEIITDMIDDMNMLIR